MKHDRKRLALAGFGLAMLAAAPLQAQELRIGLGSEATSIDPHFHNVGPNNALRKHVFQGLVTNDENQKNVPELAVSWKPVSDTDWEFKLRPDVKFSNGTAFTAKDVIYTLCRIPTVENSPSSFNVFTRGIAATRAPGFGIGRKVTRSQRGLSPQ